MIGRKRNAVVEMANAEYEIEKSEAAARGQWIRVTIPMMEKRHGLKP